MELVVYFFQLLVERVGDYWVIASLGLLITGYLAYRYFYRVRIGDPKRYHGRDSRSREEVLAYDGWRKGLISGGKVGEIYETALRAVLARVSKFFGDHDVPQGEPRLWSGPALDRCFGLALIYPILTMLLVWLSTGEAGPAGDQLGLEQDANVTMRALSAVGLIAILIAVACANMPIPVQNPNIRVMIRLAVGALVGTLAGVVAVALAGSGGAFAVAVIVVSAVAGAVLVVVLIDAVAPAGASAVAGAFAVALAGLAIAAFAGEGVFAGTIALIGAFAGVRAVAWLTDKFDCHWSVGLGVVTLYLGIIIPLALGVLPGPLQAQTDIWNWSLLVIVGALPLINALFDWLSIGLTRWLLTKGLEQGGWWWLVYAVVDLLCALVFLVALLFAIIFYLEWLNVLAARHDVIAFDIGGTLAILKSDPRSDAVLWLYVLIFTTYLPSLVNLVLGGLSMCARYTGDQWLARHPRFAR